MDLLGGDGFGLPQVGLGLLDDGVEGGRVRDGQLAEHLAVEGDAGGGEGGDEAAVLDAAQLEGGIEAGDPEGAEMALLLAAIAVRVDACLLDELLGDAIQRPRAHGETAGALQYTFTFAGVDD